MGDTRGDSEKLFLLEVLVDNFTISYSKLNLNKDLLSNLTDTCVLFQFLNYPPLVVCESDFISTSPQRSTEISHVNFKSGKSCFFSLRIPKGPLLPVPFDLNVRVTRKLGVDENRIDIGKASIDMTEEFTELLRQNVDYECEAEPVSKNKKGMFEVIDSSGKAVGILAAFVRLSCFGKLIITQFSLNKENDKSYIFKGTNFKSVCQLPGNQNERPVINEYNEPDLRRPSLIYKPTLQDYNNAQRERHSKRRLAGYSTYRESEDNTFSKRPRYEDGYYYRKEHATQSDTKECGCKEYNDRGNRGCPHYECNCSPPYNQHISYGSMLTGNVVLCNCPHSSKYLKRPNKKMDLAPGEIGIQGDQVIFQLPLKRTGDAISDQDNIIGSTVHYKLTSEVNSKDNKPNNIEQIKSGVRSGHENGNSDVFLLKIGKKMNNDKKLKLELELKNRLMKEPNPQTTDQDCQYQEGDIPGYNKETKGQEKTKKGKKKNK